MTIPVKTTRNMTATPTQCDFCNELAGGRENSFGRLYGGQPERRVLFRSDNFAVIPSLGQIVEGYLLVLPIEHFKAVGDLPDHYLEEFVTVCQRVGQILEDQYGSYIFFEHGTRSEGVGGCGIYHAHLHAVPIPPTLDPVDTLKAKFPYKQMRDLAEIREQSVGMSAYIFYQDSNSRTYLFDTPNLVSQYMRRTLAALLSANDWDWRSAAREGRLLATLDHLSTFFDGPPFSPGLAAK
jgi:diadenosine tetraphosphate (Ap4A) HIT family hydrolase